MMQSRISLPIRWITLTRKIWRAPKSAKASRYSLAVLVDPQEKFPPSNKGALHKLTEVAKKMNIHVEMITEDDAIRLLEF